MVILLYINKNYMLDWEFINIFDTEDLANNEIEDFAEKHDYTIPYWRVMAMDENWKMLDIGSHSQFYKIIEVDNFNILYVYDIKGKDVISNKILKDYVPYKTYSMKDVREMKDIYFKAASGDEYSKRIVRYIEIQYKE